MTLLTTKDHAYFEMLTKRGSNLPKDSGNRITFRTSKRFEWALEIYKRFLESDLSDSQILEHVLWEALRKENPVYRKSSQANLEKQNQLTKFFLASEEIDENGEKKGDYKYSSVVELSWSEFEIFRIIKLDIAEPRLLTNFEKEIILHLKDRPEFWRDDSVRSFEGGYINANAIFKTFESPSVDISDETSKPLAQSALQRVKDGEVDLKEIKVFTITEEELEREKRIISDNRFSEELMFSHEGVGNLDSIVVDHFGLEVHRLCDLMSKSLPLIDNT